MLPDPLNTDRRCSLPRTLLLTILALWVGISLAPAPVFAHSVIESSLPPANASLESPPRELVLRFSEPVDATFSTVTVLDREGRQVSARPVFARDERQTTVPLLEMGRGIYTVRWRVLSAVDGHVTTGFFAFGVGVSLAENASPTTAASPSVAVVLFRWIGLLAAIVLAGVAFFQTSILGPGLTQLPASVATRLARAADARLRALTVVGAWILLAGSVAEFVLQSLLLLDAPLRTLVATGALWRLLETTRAGWGLLVRASMALVLLLPWSPSGRILKVAALVWVAVVGTVATVLGGPSALASPHVALLLLVASVYGLFSVLMALILPQIPDIRLPPLQWTAPLAGALLLAGITLTSHAVGSGPLAVIGDWLHVIAVALWIGGLGALGFVVLFVTSTDRVLLTQALVGRFSTAAGLGLATVVLTGIYSAWLHVPNLQAFLVTSYGQTLLIKLLLVVPLVALGAVNRFVIRPRLAARPAQLGDTIAVRFSRLVDSEVALGSVVLLVVAVLTITPPARVSMPAVAQEPLILAGLADDFAVQLTVIPALPGWNRLTVAVRDARGQSLPPDDRVLLRFTKLDENLDRVTVPLSLRRGDAYLLEGSYIGLPGYWEVEVVVRERGRPDRSTSFPLRIGQPSATTPDAAAVRLLDRARTTIGTIRSWRQVDQIADGAGHVILTRYEMARPDRLHYRTSVGGEVVLIGATRYLREDSPTWRQESLTPPLALRGPYLEYLDGASAIRRGRQMPCEEETCQLLVWELPQVPATMVGWIGLQSGRVQRLLMVAPAHHMTSVASDFDQPITIAPPMTRTP